MSTETLNTEVINLTDRKGNLLVDEGELFEPEPGSIMLSEGPHGTAWQRHFSDGRWHSTRGGGTKTWDQLLCKRNMILVYDAKKRED